MTSNSPPPAADGVVPIATAIILTLVTCGIYALFWRYKQMETVNGWVGEERFNFVTFLLLSIVTCGIYALYFEYMFCQAINEIQNKERLLVNSNLAMISLLLSIFGLGLVSIAIQQSEINNLYA
jgi:hypothetical protein